MYNKHAKKNTTQNFLEDSRENKTITSLTLGQIAEIKNIFNLNDGILSNQSAE